MRFFTSTTLLAAAAAAAAAAAPLDNNDNKYANLTCPGPDNSSPIFPSAACYCARWHIVQPGDSCQSLGQLYSIRPFIIKESNTIWRSTIILDCDNLPVGQNICLHS